MRRMFWLIVIFCLWLVPCHVLADDSQTTARYVKLDSQGRVLPPSAAEWVMVRDNVTGLYWEIKTDDGSVHDRDNEYSWSEAHDIFLQELNDKKFGGFSDWRIPTTDELRELEEKGPEPYIDLQYFPLTVPTGYLSWRECGSGEIFPERVKFGKERNLRKNRRVRAVRGSES